MALVALFAACGGTSGDGGAPIANTVTLPAPVTSAPPVDGSLDGSLDGAWRAIAATADGVEAADLDTVDVTIVIAGDRITGSRGCNDFEVAVDIGATTITFGEGAASEAFCTGPPGEIEAAFRELASGTVGWSIEGATLTLTAPSAGWVFERTGAAPAPTIAVTTTPATSPPVAEPAVSEVEVRPVGGCFPADGEGPAPDASLGQAVLADLRGDERCVVGPAIGPGPVFEPTAVVTLDPATGDWGVVVEVRPDARAAWDEITGLCYRTEEPCASGRIAIVVGGEIVTAPTVLQPELPEVQIAGAFSEAEATAVAGAINRWSAVRPPDVHVVSDTT